MWQYLHFFEKTKKQNKIHGENPGMKTISRKGILQSTVEIANSEKASFAWCTEHFSRWRLKCSENHATLQEANFGSYFLLCNLAIYTLNVSLDFISRYVHRLPDCNIDLWVLTELVSAQYRFFSYCTYFSHFAKVGLKLVTVTVNWRDIYIKRLTRHLWKSKDQFN